MVEDDLTLFVLIFTFFNLFLIVNFSKTSSVIQCLFNSISINCNLFQIELLIYQNYQIYLLILVKFSIKNFSFGLIHIDYIQHLQSLQDLSIHLIIEINQIQNNMMMKMEYLVNLNSIHLSLNNEYHQLHPHVKHPIRSAEIPSTGVINSNGNTLCISASLKLGSTWAAGTYTVPNLHPIYHNH